MIKIQLNYREMESLGCHLKFCIEHAPITIDKEKEFFMACHAQVVIKRMFKKMLNLYANGYNSSQKHKIKLDEPEALSIYKYLNRYELPAFLFNCREQVNDVLRLNNNLLNIITQNKKYEATYKNNGFEID